MSATLSKLLKDEILAHGPISFARFMERSLYEPGLGYYAREKNPTGKAGDFITSVTVGACFGNLLAEQVADYWKHIGSPAEWHLVEQGANNGQLMQDVLTRLRESHPACAAGATIHFIEPLDSLRQQQKKRFPQAVFHREIPTTLGSHGVFVCNELIDAFPVERIRWENGQWHRHLVGLDAEGSFCWAMEEEPLSEAEIPTGEFTEGYTTECCPGLQPWVGAISQLFETGLWVITDYGLPAEEYYDQTRPDGTLRGYRQHQLVAKDLLSDPGSMDLTTHVNWTAVEFHATTAGLRKIGLVEQFRFLTALAEGPLKEWERAGLGRLTPEQTSWLRQFQTLTHPGQLGGKFQTLLLVRGALEGKLVGAKFARG